MPEMMRRMMVETPGTLCRPGTSAVGRAMVVTVVVATVAAVLVLAATSVGSAKPTMTETETGPAIATSVVQTRTTHMTGILPASRDIGIPATGSRTETRGMIVAVVVMAGPSGAVTAAEEQE